MIADKVLTSLRRLEKLKKENLEQLELDTDLQATTLWNLYVLVQGCIDLALKLVSQLSLRTPETYADAFRVLTEEKIISATLRDKLITMSGFRHKLAHIYFDLNFKTIREILEKDLDDIKEFIKTLSIEGQKRGIDIFKI